MLKNVNIKKLNAESIQEAVTILENGGILITPTRTNYNVICNPMDENAIAKVFEVKKRTKFGPLTLYIPEPKETELFVKFPEGFDASVLESVWPSELSIIFEKKHPFPDSLTMGASTIAITCQGESAIQSIAEAFGPVAMTSANLSGQGDIFVDFDKAVQDIGTVVDLIIDAGAESPAANLDVDNKSNTIVDVTFGQPYLVRQGVISLDAVRGIFPNLNESTVEYKKQLENRIKSK